MTNDMKEKNGMNSKKLVAIIISIVALVAVVAVIAVIYVNSISPSRQFQRQLDLGYQYLEELNYEQAIAAFEASIEIDPKNVEAYKGLIEAYLGQGNSDGIANTYEIASANLDKDSLGIIRSAASSGIMTIISDTLENGDKDAAREMAYTLAAIDSKSAERSILLVAGFDEEDFQSSDPDADIVGSESSTVIETDPEPEQIAIIYQPTDEEIKAAYEVASDIVVDLELWGGRYFSYDMNLWGQGDGWIPITNFSSMSQLNDYLGNYFSNNKVEEMDECFCEKNGVLCGLVGFRGGDYGYEDSWISDIIRESETEIKVVITEKYRELITDVDFQYSYYEVEFTYIYENGKWVFDKIYSLM